jgi:tagatose-6-phosphate ketose/aldose isomerase
MNPFGMDLPEIERRGGAWTAREILQQSVVWRASEALVASEQSGIREKLTAFLRNSEARVILTGAGTSAFIGNCLEPALRRRHRCEVRAVSTTDIVAGPDRYLSARGPTLVVSFARSGNSPESVAALDLADAQIPHCQHLIITCNPAGALAQRAGKAGASVLILPEETHDRAFAMTSSFSSMVLAAGLLFDLPKAAGVAGMAHAADAVLSDLVPRMQNLGAAGYERVVYLGANELKGLAQEAALKMLELTDGSMVAVADTPLGFRHGPKTVLNQKTLVVLFTSNDSYTRRYDKNLLAELRSDGIAGRVLSLSATAVEGAHGDDLLIPRLSSCADWELCLPYAVFAQSLALMQSLARGLTPDNPNAAGAVSRVVKGVSIHPWVLEQ